LIEESPQYVLAVDIGGTKMDIAFIDQFGRLLEPAQRLLVPFDDQGVAKPDAILDLLEPFVNRAKKEFGNFPGIGMSICGNIDTETGDAVLVANLYWRNVPFGRMARERFAVQNFPATDVRMALMAEVLWGKAKGLKYVAWMTLGTGYGGYLFLDGKLYGGVHGFAGNLGHNIYDEKTGDLCGCGQKGCFESFVAGPAIANQGQIVADQGKSKILDDLSENRQHPVTTKMVFQAESLGDQASKEIIEEVIRKLGISLSSMVNLLDLEMIVLGGSVWKGSPGFIKRVDKRVRDFLMTEEAKRDLKITTESFQNSALVGAAADVFLHTGLLKL
jgi:glucokinase